VTGFDSSLARVQTRDFGGNIERNEVLIAKYKLKLKGKKQAQLDFTT